MEDSDQIYEPAEDSKLLAKFVNEKAFGRVLDMGTGSGIQAFTASKKIGIRSVTAVDINPVVVKHVSDEAKKQGLQRFTVLESDLFENVEGKFETIIFNPPYLPQDYLEGVHGEQVAINDLALYGGKKGYEIIVRFLELAPKYLARGGKILLLFSSLSGREIIEKTITDNLLQFEKLATEAMPMMETLFVYEITALPVRESLVSHGVFDLKYHAKGARGLVYKGKFDLGSLQKKFLASKDIKDVAVKIKSGTSTAPGTLELEARNIRLVNKERIGPRLYLEHKDFIVMEFVSGVGLDKFIEKHGKDSFVVKLALVELLRQARKLDLLKLQKEEMHRPFANVLVSKLQDSKVALTLLDFERCRRNEKPSNVTQVISFLMKFGFVGKEEGVKTAEEYKKSYSAQLFEKIISLIQK